MKNVIGAYKDKSGTYTLLQQVENGCEWASYVKSNRSLAEVLPKGFGIQTFIPNAEKLPQTDVALFTVKVEIPQKGTDTKITFNMLPLGLFYSSSKPLVYFSKENKKYINYKNATGIQELAQDKKELIDKLFYKKITELSDKEQAFLKDFLTKKYDDEQKFSVKEVQDCIDKIKLAYTYYNQMKYDELLLGWDRQKARFYIKRKYKIQKTKSWIEFVRKSEYWQIGC